MSLLDIIFRRKPTEKPAEDDPAPNGSIREETEKRRKAKRAEDLSGCDLAVDRLESARKTRAKANETLVGAVRKRAKAPTEV